MSKKAKPSPPTVNTYTKFDFRLHLNYISFIIFANISFHFLDFFNDARKDDEIKKIVKEILDKANLEEITMKTVCRHVYSKYPDFDLSHKKEFIKTTVKSVYFSIFLINPIWCAQCAQFSKYTNKTKFPFFSFIFSVDFYIDFYGCQMPQKIV